MGFETDLDQLKEQTDNKVTMLGNIPPRDVLAKGSPEEVNTAVLELKMSLKEKGRLILSCGGGMPPGVSTGNLDAFVKAATA
jgi:uroporphyrinogen decarboxylase